MLPGLMRPLGSGLGILPQGSLAGALTSRWSVTDHYAGVVTQLGGLTFTSGGSGSLSIRGTKAAAGRVYLEYTLATAVAAQCGVANAAADLSHAPGADSAGNGLGYNTFNGGYYYLGGSNKTFSGVTQPVQSGAVIGMAVDAGASLVWFYLSNQWFGASGFDATFANVTGITTPAGPLFPIAANGSGFGGFLINTGSFPFSNLIPPGFQAWG